MVRFLTPEWIAALDVAAAAVSIDRATTLCVEHVVDAFTYHVEYHDGRVRFRPGPALSPTVRLVADRPTAEAIARGEVSAQRAFMTGVLRIEGDTMTLAQAHPALRALGDAFADLRSSTEW